MPRQMSLLRGIFFAVLLFASPSFAAFVYPPSTPARTIALVNGRTYTGTAYQALPVLDGDVPALVGQGWTLTLVTSNGGIPVQPSAGTAGCVADRPFDLISRNSKLNFTLYDGSQCVTLATLDPLTHIPTLLGNITGQFQSNLPSLVTTQTTTGGSTAQGAVYVNTTRTGGYGQYGNALYSYIVSAPTPAGQFDVGLTSWVTHTNLTGGQLFGAWDAANTPSSGVDYSGNPLSETYTGGAVIGREINAGNRWADFGLQTDIGGAHYTVGEQIVPDIGPASDGPTTTIYPGTFAQVIGHSVHGHKWWTGRLLPTDTIMPGGYVDLFHGGSVAGNAPLAALTLLGYWQTGIDFSGANYASAQLFGSNWAISSLGFTVGSNAAPVSPLQVIGSSGAPSLISDTGSVATLTSSTSAELQYGGYASAPYGFWMQTKSTANNTSAFPLYINPLGGSIAIGEPVTSTPAATLDVGGTVRTKPTTVSGLGSCSSTNEGSRWGVTDATASTFGTTAAGGGSNHVPVYCNATAWVIE